MVTELKEVIAKVERLNNNEQKQIAKMLEGEINWDATLQNTRKQLETLAKEALIEHKNGLTQKKDW